MSPEDLLDALPHVRRARAEVLLRQALAQAWREGYQARSDDVPLGHGGGNAVNPYEDSS